MSNNVQQPMPEIDETFRLRVNEIYDSWHANDIPFTEASRQLETLRQEALSDDNAMNEAGIYNILGIINGYRSKYENSIINFDKARIIYEEQNAIQRVAMVDLNLGETYRLIGNLSRAQTYFRRAYESAETLGRVDMQVIALTNEGQLQITQQTFQKARETLEQALEMSYTQWQPDSERDEVKRADNTCEIHHALAGLELRDGQLDEAWQHAVKAYEMAEFSGRIVRMGYANRIMGNVISQLGRSPDEVYTSDVDYFYKESISAFKQVKAEGEVARTLLAHGQSLAKRGKKRSAGNKYQQAMVIFTRLGMMESAAEAAQAQATVL